MITYSAVLTIKFSIATGGIERSKEEGTWGVIAGVAKLLKDLGTDPPHRFGRSALYGQLLESVLHRLECGASNGSEQGAQETSTMADSGRADGDSQASSNLPHPNYSHNISSSSDTNTRMRPATADGSSTIFLQDRDLSVPFTSAPPIDREDPPNTSFSASNNPPLDPMTCWISSNEDLWGGGDAVLWNLLS
jgi:hypothetical protein